MNKVPPVISAVGSSHSFISQVTLEDSRCSPVRSRGIENAKWSVLESPSRQTQSRNGFVDELCSSRPMQKPVRKESQGKLLEPPILRAKINLSTTNAVFNSDINVKKSSELGYWDWHNNTHNTDSHSTQDPTLNSYSSPAIERLSSPMIGRRLRDSRWSWSGTSSRPSLESESTMESSPERNPRARPRAPSMPLMMPQRKSSMQDDMDLSLMMPQRKSSVVRSSVVQDDMDLSLSQHERRQGPGSSLVHNKTVDHFPRHP
jgi:hypothetical protein